MSNLYSVIDIQLIKKQSEMIEFDSIFVIISMLLKNQQAIGRNPKMITVRKGNFF